MAKPKVDVLLDMVRRSGLVEKDRLDAALSDLKRQATAAQLADTDFMVGGLVQAGLITRWQAEKLIEGRHKGFFLGKYKLLDHLGTGGMSSVYLAEHVLMQRRVAIKVLPKNRVEDSSYLARFHREAQAAASLDHRNIVRAYDVDNDGMIHYLVMEYVEGRDLQAMVKQDGPMSYTDAAEYIRQAADGLAHAHGAGLIHRDVKPANLLVDQRNVVKVLDLGLARFTDEDRASLTVAYDENVLGTADYLAPEQALDSHGVTARADIYSLGCSLYYLLTGHPPFPDGTLPQRLMMHQKHQPPSISLDRPDVPPELVEICSKMMAKKPADRYQSMAEVARVLAGWLAANGGGEDIASGDSSRRLAAAAGSGLTAVRVAASAERLSPVALKPARRVESVPEMPSARDTSHAAAADTQAGSPKPHPASGAGSSKRGKRALPVAKPLSDADDPFAEFVLQVDNTPHGGSSNPNPLSKEEIEALRARRQQTTPREMWIVLGVGLVITFVLVIILVVRSIFSTPSSTKSDGPAPAPGAMHGTDAKAKEGTAKTLTPAPAAAPKTPAPGPAAAAKTPAPAPTAGSAPAKPRPAK